VTADSDELHSDEGDIVVIILRRVVALAPDFNRAIAGQIEAEVRAAYGGQRVRIPKRGKHLTAEERQALFQDGLSGMSTEEIMRKHRISRRTLERQMKRGGRFGG
jgi:DNA invertase Pin-like site-specific DNA recombinase